MISTQLIKLSELKTLTQDFEKFKDLMQLQVMDGAVLPLEFVKGWLENPQTDANWLGFWAIIELEIVGSGGFRSAPVDGAIEIGYSVAPGCEGKGVGTAIARSMVEFAFANGATKVIAHTLPTGYASQKILERNNFKYVGEYHDPEDGLVFRYSAIKS